MNGELASLVIYVVFLLISYTMYRVMVKVSLTPAMVCMTVYFIGIYYYFELINQLHHYLRDNGILYIEFGHSSLELIVLMLFCYLNGLVLAGLVFYKRGKRTRSSSPAIQTLA